MRIVLTVVLTLVAAAVLVLAVVYSGLYNVAASAGHGAIERWLLHTVMHRSVEVRLAAVQVPPDLADPELSARGALNYEAHCAICHLSPVRDDSPVQLGLVPQPPALEDMVRHWEPEALFWITKHGIKMTGMPGWHATLNDAEIWEVVAFLQRAPEISIEEYQRYLASPD